MVTPKTRPGVRVRRATRGKAASTAVADNKISSGTGSDMRELRLSFFVRPTYLHGTFPPVHADELQSEDDVGIELQATLADLIRRKYDPVEVPAGSSSHQVADILEREMRDAFRAAIDGEVTLGEPLFSWSPDGAPPWIKDPDPFDSDPTMICPVVIGGYDELTIEGQHDDGTRYSCGWRWFVSGRLVTP